MKIISKNTVKAGLLGAAILFGSMGSCFAEADQSATVNGAQSADANAQSTTTTQKALHLPLDHGPRAEVTPWVNAQRRMRAQQGK